jgi:hypothetical protein
MSGEKKQLRDLLHRGETEAVREGTVERDNEPALPDQSYNGEFRYVNCSPMKLRRLMAEEQDPVELEAMELAMSFHKSRSSLHQAGSVERGEPREDIRAESLKDTLGERETHVFVRGKMVVKGLPAEEGGEGESGWFDDELAELDEEEP